MERFVALGRQAAPTTDSELTLEFGCKLKASEHHQQVCVAIRTQNARNTQLIVSVCMQSTGKTQNTRAAQPNTTLISLNTPLHTQVSNCRVAVYRSLAPNEGVLDTTTQVSESVCAKTTSGRPIDTLCVAVVRVCVCELCASGGCQCAAERLVCLLERRVDHHKPLTARQLPAYSDKSSLPPATPNSMCKRTLVWVSRPQACLLCLIKAASDAHTSSTHTHISSPVTALHCR